MLSSLTATTENMNPSSQKTPIGIPLALFSCPTLSVQLNGPNYLVWKTCLLPFLRASRLLAIVDGSLPCPPEFISQVDENGEQKRIPNPAFKEWKTQDQIALAWLLNSVSDSIVTLTSKLKTSAAVWSFLTTAYAAYGSAPAGSTYREEFSPHQPQGPPTHFSQTIPPAKSAASNLALLTQTTHQHPHSANGAHRGWRRQPKCQLCLRFGHEASHCSERYNPNFQPYSPTPALPPQPRVAGGTWFPDATHYIISSPCQLAGGHPYPTSQLITEYQSQNYPEPGTVQGWAYDEDEYEYFAEEEAEYYSEDQEAAEYYLEDQEAAEAFSRMRIVG